MVAEPESSQVSRPYSGLFWVGPGVGLTAAPDEYHGILTAWFTNDDPDYSPPLVAEVSVDPETGETTNAYGTSEGFTDSAGRHLPRTDAALPVAGSRHISIGHADGIAHSRPSPTLRSLGHVSALGQLDAAPESGAPRTAGACPLRYALASFL